MRKNVKQQFALRVLSTAALMAMVSSIATAAFADTYDLNKGSVTVETKEDGFTYVTQLDNTQTDGYARNDKDDILHDYQDKTGVTITSNGEKTSNTITVETAKDQTTDVTLDKVHIEVDTSEAKSGAIEIKGDGNTNLELNGDNTVLTENQWHEEHAAIEKADAYGTGTLTIKDDLNDKGEEKTGTDEDSTLVAGGFHQAAAIGGGKGEDLRDTSNITITGGKITAIGGNDGAAAIGGGYDGTGKNIRIEGNAHVIAAAGEGAAIGGGTGSGNSVTITDDAVVKAYSAYDAAIGGGDSEGRLNSPSTITISGNATVHAETSQGGCAIGSGRYGSCSDLTINIEKNADVTAIGSSDAPAIGNRAGTYGTTTINITGGTLTKVVHNRKYMDENPNIDTSKLKDEDLHDWKLVGEVVQPTLEKDGYADYICSIDKCGQTKHVVLPKLTPEPSEPDTPNKPDTPDTPDTPSTPDVPSTPEVTPADPAVTPDAPAQDGTAPADTLTTDTTATAQNVAQNAEPKAAAPAAALPQTGANWLAVVGSALSGMFLLAAGFVLDRKNRRMN